MRSTSATASALVAALLALPADAFWRMECHSRVGLARIDPLVNPGEAAAHAHVLHGGGNIGFNSNGYDLQKSDCTSCMVTQDKSNYWTPSFYFQHSNGTFEVVPQVGGMLAYYLLYGENLKAFPPDFRLIAGDTKRRAFHGPVPDKAKSGWKAQDKTQDMLAEKALGFNCLNYKKDPEASLYRHFLPDKKYLDANCADGIRMELMFPSCWNGKDLDSKDHKSHMAYPDLVTDGTCPKGFSQRMPSLFYETIWNTYAFKGLPGKFVLANGDTTGFGYHGDFINGWESGVLERAVKKCTNPSGKIQDCPVFNLQSQDQAAKCKLKLPKVIADEDCEVSHQVLPGDVKVGGDSPANNPQEEHPPPPAITPKVPTLSYSKGTHPITDKHGGGLSAANYDRGKAAKPKITPAPAPPSNEQHKILSTSTYTKHGTVYEVVWEEVITTVTAEKPQKRLLHMHRRHHHGIF